MVQFEEDTRAALFDAGILAVDENGKTVFTGLTAAETRFLMDYDESESRDEVEHLLFQELLEKFHMARQAAVQNAKNLVFDQLSRYGIRSSGGR